MSAAPVDIDVEENETQTPVFVTLVMRISYCIRPYFSILMTFFHLYADRNEKRRQRQRLYYAQNREEILKRQRQPREQKRKATALLNGIGSVSHTPATG
jgi:hypothetical protein